MNRSEKRVRLETRKYQVPVTRYYKKTVMETREKQVPVPYFVNMPETKYKTVNEQVPVERTKVQMDEVVKTVYDVQTRTRCVPETKMVTKTIPVYRVVARPAPPCPPNDDSKTDDAAGNNNENFVSYEEYTKAHTEGNMSEAA